MQVRSRLPNRRIVGGFAVLSVSVVMMLSGVLLGVVVAPAAGAQDAPIAPAPVAEQPSDPGLVTNGPDQLGQRVSESEAATKRLNLAVVGLLGLAGLIAVATVVFWKLSAPVAEDRTAITPAFRIEFIPDAGVDDAVPAPAAAVPGGAAAPAWLATAPPASNAPDVTMEPVAPVAGAWASQGWGADS